jgi:stage V sporulation protein D (sporulation-specific penicillin-binding protein)
MLSAIDVLDIEKRENELEREYLYTDKQYAVVPNVIGMEVKDAVKELKKFKIEYSGEGSVVTYQSPSEGESIYEGETIRLLLSE